MSDIPKSGFVARWLKNSAAKVITEDDQHYQGACECYRQISELAENHFSQTEPALYEVAKNNRFLFRKLHHEKDSKLPYADVDTKNNTIMFETENPVFASCILTFIAEQGLTKDALLKMKTNTYGEYAQITLKEPNKEKITDLYTSTFPHASRIDRSSAKEITR